MDRERQADRPLLPGELSRSLANHFAQGNVDRFRRGENLGDIGLQHDDISPLRVTARIFPALTLREIIFGVQGCLVRLNLLHNLYVPGGWRLVP